MRILLPLCALALMFLFFVVRTAPRKLRIEDLEGHWHLVRDEGVPIDDQTIFSIGPDTTLVCYYRNDTAGVGMISSLLDTLVLPYGHGWRDVVITKVEQERIAVKWLADTTVKMYLQRHAVDRKHLQHDFFADDRIQVHLPKDSPQTYPTEMYTQFEVGVYLGNPSTVSENSDLRLTMKLGNKMSDLLDPEDVWLNLEQARVKMPERIRHLIKPTLYFDEAVSNELLEDFQQLFAAFGYDTVYRVHEVPAGPENFQLSYQPLIAPALPDSVMLIAKPSKLLCLGIADNTNYTLDVSLPDASRRVLPDSMGYGFYQFFSGDNAAFGLEVAFNGESGLWRAENQGQYFVSARFDTPAYRLWNGLQVGVPVDRYAHLRFVRDGNTLRREENRFSYVLTIGDDGRITSIEVFSNYFWEDKGASGTEIPWMPYLRDRPDCRLRIW